MWTWDKAALWAMSLTPWAILVVVWISFDQLQFSG